jgi:hypothetical protein
VSDPSVRFPTPDNAELSLAGTNSGAEISTETEDGAGATPGTISSDNSSE